MPDRAAAAAEPPPAPPAGGLRRAALPLLLIVLVLLQAQLRPLRPGPRDPLSLLGGSPQVPPVTVTLRGRLLEEPRPPSCRGLLQVEADGQGRPLRGRTELLLAPCTALRQGWRLEVEGTLGRPAPAPHPLLAGSAERLARLGAWTRLRVSRLEVLERRGAPLDDLRRRIAGRLRHAAGDERGGLLAALVLGSAVSPPSAAVRESFRSAGLSHALAASGFHLSVLLGAVLAVARGLGRPLRLALAAGAIGLFVLLAGPQPSVVRAALMSATALLVLEGGLRGRPLGILGVTLALMLLVRPGWLHAVGFQLSAAATAGLVISAGSLERWLAVRLPSPLPARRLAPLLAVPMAASLWTLPLQVFHFGSVPVYAVAANLLAAPLLAPLTLLAMAMALAAVAVPPLVGPLALPAGLLAGPLLAIARGVAALPMAQWQTGRPQPWLVVLLAVALLGWAIPGLAGARRRQATVLLVGVTALHLTLLGGDRLVVVREETSGGRDLLLARHGGRGALIASHADRHSCLQAGRLAGGLGIRRLDWILLLDPVAPEEPACWGDRAGVVVAYGEAGRPLAAGQRLASRGLEVTALSMDSHALLLEVGRQRWALLPDRQALWAWQERRPPGVERLWLGFVPRPAERRRLREAGAAQVWLSGPRGSEGLPGGWRASGRRGWLEGG